MYNVSLLKVRASRLHFDISRRDRISYTLSHICCSTTSRHGSLRTVCQAFKVDTCSGAFVELNYNFLFMSLWPSQNKDVNREPAWHSYIHTVTHSSTEEWLNHTSVYVYFLFVLIQGISMGACTVTPSAAACISNNSHQAAPTRGMKVDSYVPIYSLFICWSLVYCVVFTPVWLNMLLQLTALSSFMWSCSHFREQFRTWKHAMETAIL